MGVYTKTKDGLKRLDGSDSVQGKLDSHEKNSNIHVTAAEKSRWEKGGDLAKHESNHYIHMQEDDTGELNIVDDNGYVIAKIDAEGLNAKNVKVDGKPVSKMIEEAIEGFEPGNGDDSEGLTRHINDKENPHEVSKEQVGLGNVDNTSDKDKPVSTAQQTAMDNLQKAMSEQIVSESKEWHIVDSEGNIVATIDANGVSAVDFLLNGKSIKTFFDSGTPGLEYGNTSTTGKVDTDIGAGEIACVGVGSSSTTDIDIASHYYSYIVSQVGAYGGTIGRDFRSSNITSVRIPSTVVHIRDYAFANCEELKYVTISEHGQELVINGNAFQYCTSLGNIQLPNRVTGIGARAFIGCTSLISIILPGSLKFGNFSYGIFQSSGLQRIYFEEGFELIPNTMCRLCENLTYVSIPTSVTKIYLSAFQECKSLKELTYDGTIAEWNSIEKIGLDAYSDDYTLTVKCTDGDVTFDTSIY